LAGRIDDLRVSEADSGTITLSWTAPCDDDVRG
jgi:hypothetical protein